MAKRNSSIDIFRLVAVALVIIQHYRLFNMDTAGALWTGFYCRIAVPFFFMVSGYFSWREESERRTAFLKKQISTIGSILLGSSVFLLIWDLLVGFKIEFSVKNVINLGLFNEPKFLFGHAHMWYMLALIYIFVIGLGVEKLRLHKLAYAAAPVLFAAGFLLDFYLFAHGHRYACYTRNFLFDGLPFFYMGQLVHRLEPSLMRSLTKRRSLLLLLAAVICMWLEATVMMNLGQNLSRTFYLSIPLLSFGVFTVLLNFPNIGAGTFLARYARDASMIIYIIHHAVEDTIKYVAERFWGVEMFRHSTLRFLLIFLISGVIGFGYAIISERLHRRASLRAAK